LGGADFPGSFEGGRQNQRKERGSKGKNGSRESITTDITEKTFVPQKLQGEKEGQNNTQKIGGVVVNQTNTLARQGKGVKSKCSYQTWELAKENRLGEGHNLKPQERTCLICLERQPKGFRGSKNKKKEQGPHGNRLWTKGVGEKKTTEEPTKEGEKNKWSSE